MILALAARKLRLRLHFTGFAHHEIFICFKGAAVRSKSFQYKEKIT